MFERDGQKFGSILVDGHRNAPSSGPKKAAEKAPAKAESKAADEPKPKTEAKAEAQPKAEAPKSEAKAEPEPKQAEKPKSSGFKSALDKPKG